MDSALMAFPSKPSNALPPAVCSELDLSDGSPDPSWGAVASSADGAACPLPIAAGPAAAEHFMTSPPAHTGTA